MDIQIISSYVNAAEARGLVIIVDVIRAFSTACYMFNGRVRHILAVADLDAAYQLKKKHPHCLLVGERNRLPLPGFDYGNSPAQIQKANLTNKTVIFTTTSGVRGIACATTADEIITGAFVNAAATASYIKQRNPKTVSFVCTDDRWPDNEDHLFAEYMQATLLGLPTDFAAIVSHMAKHPAAVGFIRKPLTPYAKKDFSLCFKLNRFPFVIRAKKQGDIVILEKIPVGQ